MKISRSQEIQINEVHVAHLYSQSKDSSLSLSHQMIFHIRNYHWYATHYDIHSYAAQNVPYYSQRVGMELMLTTLPIYIYSHMHQAVVYCKV